MRSIPTYSIQAGGFVHSWHNGREHGGIGAEFRSLAEIQHEVPIPPCDRQGWHSASGKTASPLS